MKKRALARREILGVLRAQMESLRSRGVKRVGLFGSYARGRQTKSSDIDLLLEFERPSFDNFVEVSNYLEQLLGRKVDVLTPEGIQGIRVKEVAESIKRSIVYV
jgi:hypothetical protein